MKTYKKSLAALIAAILIGIGAWLGIPAAIVAPTAQVAAARPPPRQRARLLGLR